LAIPEPESGTFSESVGKPQRAGVMSNLVEIGIGSCTELGTVRSAMDEGLATNGNIG